MSRPDREPHERLLAHLLEASEDERREMELDALEDDDFFDQLRAAETELLDRYVRGELDDAASLRLAELIGRSRRLQESAETTLALQVRDLQARDTDASPRSRPRPAPTSPGAPALSTEGTSRSASRWRFLPLLTGLLLGLAVWMLLSMRQELHEVRQDLHGLEHDQRVLEGEVQRLEREVEKLQQEQLNLQRRWAEETTGE